MSIPDYYLFLDDERYPLDVTWIKLPLYNWEIVRNYEQFVDIIEKRGLPKAVTLDHDIGTNSKTGYDAAKWLTEYCKNNKLSLPDYYLHSMNPIGRANINSLFESYKKFFNDDKK